MLPYKLIIFDWEGTLYNNGIEFDPDIVELLNSLHKQGHILAIATSKYRCSLMPLLEQYNITQLFSTLRCGDDEFQKPDPKLLLDILSEFDIAAKDAVMIGDSAYDIAMAEAAKVAAIAVGPEIEELEQYHPVAALSDVLELFNRSVVF